MPKPGKTWIVLRLTEESIGPGVEQRIQSENEKYSVSKYFGERVIKAYSSVISNPAKQQPTGPIGASQGEDPSNYGRESKQKHPIYSKTILIKQLTSVINNAYATSKDGQAAKESN